MTDEERSPSVSERLAQVAEDLHNDQPTLRPTVREFLSWIGAQRRGVSIVSRLRNELEKAGIETEPDFESAYLDSTISFRLAQPEEEDRTPADEEGDEGEGGRHEPDVFADPTYRISKLGAANTAPTSVSPDDTLQSAVTVMLANDYSQLPVMTSPRSVKGVVTWRSIGSRLALGQETGPVRTFMDPAAVVSGDTSLFDVIARIVEHDYVLVKATDQEISGIVTSSDLAQQFRLLTEPFLLLSEIENQIRGIIRDRYDLEDLRSSVDPDGPDRDIAGVADLTFGEYVRLLQNPEQWDKLEVSVDRAVFVDRLDEVRRIRNDVMHFDPDGIPDQDLETLRDFSQLLQRLNAIGVF